MTRRQRLLRIVLPILILLLGVVGMRLLVLSRQAPPKLATTHNTTSPTALVDVQTLSSPSTLPRLSCACT